MATNVDKLREAYRIWGESRGGDARPWLALVSDDFVFRSVGEEPALGFSGVHSGASQLTRYFDAILADWRMEFYQVDALFGDEDQVAMFGTCGWTHRKTGATVTTPIANLWRFRDGKAYECVEIFDSARAVAAATSA